MYRAGRKHPLRECLGENSNEPQAKRRRFENIVLLRGGRRNHGLSDRGEINGNTGNEPEALNTEPRRIIRAGKRKKPGDVEDDSIAAAAQTPEKETDENDIISELTKEFKKARLRPVFFTISSFVEQTVDEVGFTMAEDEPEETAEVTIRLNVTRSSSANDVSTASNVFISEVTEEATLTVTPGENEMPKLAKEQHSNEDVGTFNEDLESKCDSDEDINDFRNNKEIGGSINNFDFNKGASHSTGDRKIGETYGFIQAGGT